MDGVKIVPFGKTLAKILDFGRESPGSKNVQIWFRKPWK